MGARRDELARRERTSCLVSTPRITGHWVRTCPNSRALAIEGGVAGQRSRGAGTWLEYLDHNDLRSEELQSFDGIYSNAFMILYSLSLAK